MATPQDRRPRRHRGVVLLVVAALLIAGILYGGDRLARSIVEGRIATQLQTELATTDKPSVQLKGFPFLAAVLSGRIDSAHVVADGIGATDERTVGVDHLEMDLNGLTSPDWFTTVTAAEVSGTARLSYSTFQNMAGTPLTYAGDGRIEVSVTSKVLSVDVNARVSGRPEVDVTEQTVSLADPKMSVGNVTIPDFTARALLDSVVKPFPVTGIPFGLTLSSIEAGPDGVVAGVTGTDVVVRGS